MNATDVMALGVAPTLGRRAGSENGSAPRWSFSLWGPREPARRRFPWFASEGNGMRHENNAHTAANVNVLDLTHDAICVRNIDGVIEYWNRAAETLYGWKAEEAVGRISHALFKTVFPASLDQIEAELGRTGYWEGELVHARKDGTRVTVASRWALQRDGASTPIRILETNSDITERKRGEAERAKLEERLRRAEKMEAIGCFASGIAHDFSNVLGGILAYGEMLFDEEPENTPRKRYAHNVLTAATRGRELVDQILAYTRSQRGKRAPTDVCRTVSEALELVRSALPASIVMHAAIPDVPVVVMGDATQLHQIVTNLCSNAIHAMKAGGLLRVAVTPVDIHADCALSHGSLRPGRYVLASVEDEGCGMDEATLAHIFEPFYTTKEIGSGTGLGLSLVHAIVTAYDGAIDVKTEPAEGSTFSIYLPMAKVSNTSAATA